MFKTAIGRRTIRSRQQPLDTAFSAVISDQIVRIAFGSQALRLSLSSNVKRCDTMNMIRAKIIAFWLLFLVFCLLLGFSWTHRLLWMGLFLPSLTILLLIKPRLPSPPPKLKLLFQLGCVVFLFAFIVHGFLFPYSAGLYLLMKILCPFFLLPALCWKAYLDYAAFRTPLSRSA